MSGEDCQALDFLFFGQASYQAFRDGLLVYIEAIEEFGLSDETNSFYKIAHRDAKSGHIFEFKKGDLRLFFFKGHGKDVVICTDGVIKKTNKVDSKKINAALRMRNDYWDDHKNNNITYE